jgi:L-threonylcarbamoyladenylate synthase
MPARLYHGSERSLALLARALRHGELVAVPTETVYGLAASAFDPAACLRIFKVKGRPAHDPLIVHVTGIRAAANIARLNEAARALARHFWPGPLTLVLDKKPNIPDLVTAGSPSVAVRAPRHRLLRRLLRLSGLPLAAPSANPFGYLSPTTAAHVQESLGHKISHILDGGACRIGLESTIVDVRDPRRPVLLRPGVIGVPALERVLGVRVRVRTHLPSHGRPPAAAPGMLSRHYSPRTPLVLARRITPGALFRSAADEAWLFFAKPGWLDRPAHNVAWLDRQGRPEAAARRLFSILRRFDRAGFRLIHAETAPAGNAGAAINDRLRRAAAKD